jgi:hypothetical protein
MRYTFFLPLIFALMSCSDILSGQVERSVQQLVFVAFHKANDHRWLVPFERSEIELNLREKVDSGIPLIVHALVPLCDNNYQGIVPTTKSLGDGFNLKTNLYWATRHGMKRYFNDHHSWKTEQVVFTANDIILERVAFSRNFENGARVMLICDAYRGDQMRACVSDYFHFLAGKKKDSLLINEAYISCGQHADMIVFNGHNGIYEAGLDSVFTVNKRQKDAVVIACSSYWNFVPGMRIANCFPLVTTTESMYPGATVLDKIIEKWALLEDAETIRMAAAQGYNEMKNCGAEACNRMFHSGW